jgi:putative membrane protein
MLGGYLIEVLGVHTGFPFGNYQYLDNLGFKVWEVPLLIGLNWWIMVYGSLQIMQRMSRIPILQIVGASILMAIFDIFLEMQATRLGMWQWEQVVPPLQNYGGWLLAGAGLAAVGRKKLAEELNPLAAILFIIQGIFFVALTLAN